MKGVTKEKILLDLDNYNKPVSYSFEVLQYEFAEMATRDFLEGITVTMGRIEQWCRGNKIKYSLNEKSYVYTFSKITLKNKPMKEQTAMQDQIKCGYFIYVYYKVGNVGSNDVKIIDEQPEEGFETEYEAVKHLKKLILAKKGYHFDRDWYKFTILKTWNSLSDV